MKTRSVAPTAASACALTLAFALTACSSAAPSPGTTSEKAVLGVTVTGDFSKIDGVRACKAELTKCPANSLVTDSGATQTQASSVPGTWQLIMDGTPFELRVELMRNGEAIQISHPTTVWEIVKDSGPSNATKYATVSVDFSPAGS